MKKQNGITLIALVITIIVLLILAGVSISMVSGNNGIITKANQAAEKTSTETQEEIDKLGDAKDYIDSKVNASGSDIETDTSGDSTETEENVPVLMPDYGSNSGFEVNYNEIADLLNRTTCYYVKIKADIAETINFYVKLTSAPDSDYVPAVARQPYYINSGGAYSYPGTEIGTSTAGSYSAYDILAIEVPDTTNDYTVKVEYVYESGKIEYWTCTKPVSED